MYERVVGWKSSQIVTIVYTELLRTRHPIETSWLQDCIGQTKVIRVGWHWDGVLDFEWWGLVDGLMLSVEDGPTILTRSVKGSVFAAHSLSPDSRSGDSSPQCWACWNQQLRLRDVSGKTSAEWQKPKERTQGIRIWSDWCSSGFTHQGPNSIGLGNGSTCIHPRRSQLILFVLEIGPVSD